MTRNAADLPDDIDALKARVLERFEHEPELREQIEALEQHIEQRVEQRIEQRVKEHYEQRYREALARELARFREQLNIALAKRFGPSSEQIPDEQLRLFNEAEAMASEEPDEPEPIAVAPHTRAKRGRRPLPETLERVEVVHDLADEDKRCPHDGAALERIGEESSEQLDVIPAKVQVIRHVRAKYACPACHAYVRTAPVPAAPIPKSIASPGLLAHVTVSKYADALPLYRQERIWQRLGADIPRATLAHWMVKCGRLVQPLVNLLREELLALDYIHADETPVQVLKEPGKSAHSKSFMWVQVAGDPKRPIVLFDYDPSRGGAIPKRLLGEFRGYLHTDGYEGYGPVCRENSITQLGCWSHVRRKFDEVLKAAGINPRQPPKGRSPPKARRALRALGLIGHLFAIEQRIRGKPPDERHRIRQQESVPVLDKLRAWLDAALPETPPASALGRALGYLDAQWPKLIRYCEDGRLEMHNNRAENAIRPFVLGRKNWLFSDSVAGAKASANLYSLVETAKANALEPYLYLRHVFTELPKANTVDDIEALLPYNCDPKKLFDSITPS